MRQITRGVRRQKKARERNVTETVSLLPRKIPFYPNGALQAEGMRLRVKISPESNSHTFYWVKILITFHIWAKVEHRELSDSNFHKGHDGKNHSLRHYDIL